MVAAHIESSGAFSVLFFLFFYMGNIYCGVFKIFFLVKRWQYVVSKDISDCFFSGLLVEVGLITSIWVWVGWLRWLAVVVCLCLLIL